MKTNLPLKILLAITLGGFASAAARANTYTNFFFTGSQTATLISSNANAVTIQSGDYRFTYSVDGLWAACPSCATTGRFFSVFWPTGVQAQAITAGPLVGQGANITIKRADGKPFDLWKFTAKLLASTGGAGGAFEITPQLSGNDDPNAPYTYDATGGSGQSFSYTPNLRTNDTYKIHLWNEWAMTSLTLLDTNPPTPPAVNFSVAASAAPVGAGSVGGTGSFPSNSTCSLVATANAGWGFKNWTENGASVSSAATYNLTVRSNRTLVANFVPAYSVSTTLSPAYGGTVSAGGTFNSNALVNVTATPITGFRFVSWTEFGSVVSTAANYNFNISSDRSLTANFAPAGPSAIFDFDTGTPSVGAGQGLPATQTKNGLTATFSTLAGAWSVQETFYYNWKPAVFSGNFLYPTTSGSSMAVEFSQPVTNFTMTFFTGEVSSEYDTAAQVFVTAYTNSAMTTAVATGMARGAWVNGAYPSGTLSFASATPFTKVKIEVPTQAPAVSYLLFVDNLIVQLAAPVSYAITASATPPGAGLVTGAGQYLPGETVTMQATPTGSFHFANWTEGGVEVSTSSIFVFDALTNRALVANFTTNQPPVALGGAFYQLAGQPLAISVWDLMYFDYDPDFDAVDFVSASVTTSNGLPLSVDTNTWQILVPANTLADGFSYTIADYYGATATGTATISIITNVASVGTTLDFSIPGHVGVNFVGVPWYWYECQRATNATFTGTLQSFAVQAGFDGAIYVQDGFMGLPQPPPQAFYRLRYTP